MEVEVGQLWRDGDKRMDGRSGYVVRIEDGKAVIQVSSRKQTRISLHRMNNKGNGWHIVRSADGTRLNSNTEAK